MGKSMHSLKTLRDIALEYGLVEHPDLASMARELGSVVHRHTARLAQRLETLQQHRRHTGVWLLGEYRHPALRVLVKAWPANQHTPLREHADCWELTLALHGALELHSYRHDAGGELLPHGHDWLGPGDARWFERDAALAWRCRNLSRHATAYSLHVCGGTLPARQADTLCHHAAARLAAPSHLSLTDRAAAP